MKKFRCCLNLRGLLWQTNSAFRKDQHILSILTSYVITKVSFHRRILVHNENHEGMMPYTAVFITPGGVLNTEQFMGTVV